MKKTALTFIAATLLSPIALAAPVQAQANDFVIQVDASGLDLTTAKDQARLQTRIRSAVRSACRADSRSLRELQAAAECEDNALHNAQERIDLALAKTRSGAERQNLR